MQNDLPTLLRIADVKRRTGLTETSLYRAIQAGKFPRPVKLSERSSAWIESEVTEYIAARIAARDHTPPRAA